MQLPAEFEKKMKNLLGDEWEAFLNCYSQDKYQALRFNPLKVRKEEEEKLLKRLGAAEIECVPWAEHGYYYTGDCRPGKHPWHECGLYYIQEPSAMSAAALLAPEPGMRVLDLCAAPGGKSTQISSFLGGEGLLISNEINAGRCRILSQNIERLGIPNCIVTNQDSASLAEHFPSYFHAILVDAPCSGEGMFRKIPEAGEEWSPENVTLCAERQAEILDNAAAMLMPGGKMVYSTCTFSPEENECQIADFLFRHPEFHVKKTRAPFFEAARPEWIGSEIREEKIRNMVGDTFRLWPHRLHGEGHFVAVLCKSGELDPFRLKAEYTLHSNPPETASGHTNTNFGDENTIAVEVNSNSAEADRNSRNENSNFADRNMNYETMNSNYDRKAARKAARREARREEQRVYGKEDRKAYGREDRKTYGKESRNNKPEKKTKGSSMMKKGRGVDTEDAFSEFLSQTVSDSVQQYVKEGTLTSFGDQLYRLPEGAPSLEGLRVMRAGLQIGAFCKDRFEPSHAFALALSPEDVPNSISLSLDDPRCSAYFRGETFDIDDKDFRNGTMPQKGWCLITIEGYSAGWGKIAGGRLKNHYPKGLRTNLEV